MAGLHISGQTALVTGGTGFIGSRLCKALSRAGCGVHSVSRRAEPHEEGNVRWWSGDFAETTTARKILTAVRPDLIFHLAGHVSGARDVARILPTFRDNLTSTVNLLTEAAEIGCRRILLAGSQEEPGPGTSQALPCSPYAASKLAASAYGRMFHALYGVPVVHLRLFMVYGPGQTDLRKLVPYVILSLLKNEAPLLSCGSRLVDWIYVEDVVEALLAATQTPGIEGTTIDIGSGNLISVREIASHLTRLINANKQPTFGVLPERPMEQVCAANLAETKALIGWEPQTSIAEGLRQTVAWYERQMDHEILAAASQSSAAERRSRR
jgi:UDP-glucose 4-epimerase